MQETTFRIGRLAKIAGVSIDTIRFYEREGLLAPCARRASGYREYDQRAVHTLDFIRQAKALGLSLKAIHGLLGRHMDPEAKRAALHEAVSARLHWTLGQIDEMVRTRDELMRVIGTCVHVSDSRPAPILTAFFQLQA